MKPIWQEREEYLQHAAEEVQKKRLGFSGCHGSHWIDRLGGWRAFADGLRSSGNTKA